MGLTRVAVASLSLAWLALAGGGGGADCRRRLDDVAGADETGDATSRRRSTASAAGDEPWCGEVWWEEDYEYAYVESYMVVSLVGLALLFETFHHCAHHRSHRAYVFGRDRDDARHEASHDDVQHSLLADLTSRATSEFTVLGFLAFVIWCVSRGGGFDEIANRVGQGEEGARFPRSGYEYLHMLEDVHMHLFVGMVFYFSFMYQIVSGTFRTLRGWEARDIACGLREKNGSGEMLTVDASGLLTQLSVPGHPRFSKWRRYFFASLVNFQDQFPDRCAELESFCKWRESMQKGEQATSSVAAQNASRTFYRSLSHANRITLCLDDWFPFGKFLAMNTRVLVENMIDFGFSTWLATALLMIFSGFLAKVVHTDYHVLLPWYVGLTLLVFGGISVFFSYWERHVGETQVWRHRLYSLHHKVPIELLLIRLLQIMLFYVSYSTSRMIASRDEWEHHFFENVAFVAVFLALQFALRLGVSDIIVHFVGLTCVGEFMGDDNFARLAKILEKRQEGYGQVQLAQLDPHIEPHGHLAPHPTAPPWEAEQRVSAGARSPAHGDANGSPGHEVVQAQNSDDLISIACI